METISRSRTAPAVFQWLVFPVVLGGSVAGAMFAISNGTDPGAAILPPQLFAALAVAVLEHVYPLYPSWNRPRRDLRVDATHTLVITVLVGIVRPFVFAGGATLAGWLSGRLGSELWPSTWPVLAQLTLALVVGDLPGYAVHRLAHTWDGLWRLHATHHSAPRLYWLNAGRFHPLDTLLTFVPSYGLLVLLGCGAEVMALLTIVTFVHGVLRHANLQLRLGPLNHFFSMAELHRWLHSRTLAEANHNYGQNVILWDTLFGTRFLPKDREPPEAIGLPDLPNFPMTWWAQIQSPFHWAKVRSESGAR